MGKRLNKDVDIALSQKDSWAAARLVHACTHACTHADAYALLTGGRKRREAGVTERYSRQNGQDTKEKHRA